jgi:hypothetical protein
VTAVDAGQVVIVSWFEVSSSYNFSMTSRAKRRNRARKLKMSDDGEEETFSGIRAPIIGFEVVDRREKFTVSFECHVRDCVSKSVVSFIVVLASLRTKSIPIALKSYLNSLFRL